jgi:hypothetical protein
LRLLWLKGPSLPREALALVGSNITNLNNHVIRDGNKSLAQIADTAVRRVLNMDGYASNANRGENVTQICGTCAGR